MSYGGGCDVDVTEGGRTHLVILSWYEVTKFKLAFHM